MLFERLPVSRAPEKPDFLESALTELRSIPYAVWLGTVGSVYTKRETGPDGKPYELTLSANWVFAGARDIRVTVTLQRSWRMQRVSETFVVTPTNTVLTSG